MKSARLRTTVLDANALLDFLLARGGVEQVKKLMRQAAEGQLQLLISIINWGEVYYVVWQNRGLATAERVLQQIAALPIQIVNTDSELTKLAASFRVKYKLPYADCFAAALAQQRKATLATGDKDFAQVEHAIRIVWTR